MKKDRARVKFQFRIKQFLILACFAAIVFSACGKNEANKIDETNTSDKTTQEAAGEQTTSKATYDQISQEEAKSLMDTEQDAIILDVRTEEEYAVGHIPGAICIPNESIDDTITVQFPDKDQLILIYCRSGNRSKQASEKLVNLGYTNIKEFGGINTWPYETE